MLRYSDMRLVIRIKVGPLGPYRLSVYKAAIKVSIGNMITYPAPQTSKKT